MDGWVDGPAIQSDFLKSGLPSYTVGVSVGRIAVADSYVHGQLNTWSLPWSLCFAADVWSLQFLPS